MIIPTSTYAPGIVVKLHITVQPFFLVTFGAVIAEITLLPCAHVATVAAVLDMHDPSFTIDIPGG